MAVSRMTLPAPVSASWFPLSYYTGITQASAPANFPRQVQTLTTQNGLVKSEVYCYDAINIEDPGASPRLNYKTSYFYSALDATDPSGALTLVTRPSTSYADVVQTAEAGATQSPFELFVSIGFEVAATRPSASYCMKA